MTSFSLAEDSMKAAPQESASFFPSSGFMTLRNKTLKTPVMKLQWHTIAHQNSTEAEFKKKKKKETNKW